MLKKITIIACLALTLGIFATIARSTAPKSAATGQALHSKARYYYVEGSVALAEGRIPEAYELMKKAAEIDPGYQEAAYNYALLRMTLRNDTLQSPSEVKRSIAMMRPFVESYPEEAAEAMNYSFLAARSGDLDEAIRVAERTDSLAPSLTATLLQLAQYYSIKQDFDKAIGALDRYERIEGSDPDLALRKLSLMLNRGDTVALLNESSRLVAENPVNPDYILIRGNVYEAIEMPDSAFACYSRAEILDPDNGKTKLTLANFFLERGDSAAYDEKSREALLCDNIMLEEKLQMMTRYMQNIIADSADTSRGTRLFDGMLAQYPHEPEVLDLGAQYFAAIGNLGRAEELMAYATDLDPENPDYWLRLASFYFTDDKYADSEKVCEQALGRLGDGNRGLLTVYGAATLMNGDYDKARDAYQRQIDLDLPGALITDSASTVLAKAANLDYESLMRLAAAYAQAGDCSSKQDDIPRAIREYEVSLTLDPTNMMTANNYAYFLALAGHELDKAEQLSRKAVDEQPDNATFIDTLGWILYLKGEYAEALDVQQNAIDKISEDDTSAGEFWDHLGDIQYRSGLKDKALESWKKAKALGCDNKQLPEKIRTKKLTE